MDVLASVASSARREERRPQSPSTKTRSLVRSSSSYCLGLRQMTTSPQQQRVVFGDVTNKMVRRSVDSSTSTGRWQSEQLIALPSPGKGRRQELHSQDSAENINPSSRQRLHDSLPRGCEAELKNKNTQSGVSDSLAKINNSQSRVKNAQNMVKNTQSRVKNTQSRSRLTQSSVNITQSGAFNTSHVETMGNSGEGQLKTEINNVIKVSVADGKQTEDTTGSVAASPLEALFTAPTKFKPLSSHRSNSNINSPVSSSSLLSGSPATPKRLKICQENRPNDNSKSCNSKGSADSSSRSCHTSCSPTSNLDMLTRVASMDNSQLELLTSQTLLHKDRSESRIQANRMRLETSCHSRSGASALPSSLSDCYEYDEAEAQDSMAEISPTTCTGGNANTGGAGDTVTSSNNSERHWAPSVSDSEGSSTSGRKRLMSSYCSSIDGDEDMEDGHRALLSPDALAEDDIFSEYVTNSKNNNDRHLKNTGNNGIESNSNKPSGSRSKACTNYVKKNNSSNFRVSPSMPRLSTLESSSCTNSELSTQLAVDVVAGAGRIYCSSGASSAPDSGSTLLQKQPSEMSRREKSLGLLGERFLMLFPLECAVPATPLRLVLDDVAAQLSTERRRIYDIVNVLESLSMATKVGKNVYQWSGSLYLSDTLARLRALGEQLGLPRLMQAMVTHGTLFKFPAVTLAGICDSRREKSLGIICQKLLMLLLAAPTPQILSMEAAVQIIVCGEDSSTEECSNDGGGSLTRTYSRTNSCSSDSGGRLVRSDSSCSLGQTTSSDESTAALTLLSPCVSETSNVNSGGNGSNYSSVDNGNSSNNSSSRSVRRVASSASATGSLSQQHRARGRRMYDIANVLTALKLVKRLAASRSLQYTGPDNLPVVDPMQDLDLFSSCQRQSLLRSRQLSGSGRSVGGSAGKRKLMSRSNSIACTNTTGRSVSSKEAVSNIQPDENVSNAAQQTSNTKYYSNNNNSFASALVASSTPSPTALSSVQAQRWQQQQQQDFSVRLGAGLSPVARQQAIASNIQQRKQVVLRVATERARDLAQEADSTPASSFPENVIHKATRAALDSGSRSGHVSVSRPVQQQQPQQHRSGAPSTVLLENASPRGVIESDAHDGVPHALGGAVQQQVVPAPVCRATGSPVTVPMRAAHCRLPRINSESALPDAHTRNSKSTTWLLAAAELALEELRGEERVQAKLKQEQDEQHRQQMKQIQYLVSPVYSRELHARKMNSLPVSMVSTTTSNGSSLNQSISSGSKTLLRDMVPCSTVTTPTSDAAFFAVPTRAAPRSPLYVTRAMTSTTYSGMSSICSRVSSTLVAAGARPFQHHHHHLQQQQRQITTPGQQVLVTNHQHQQQSPRLMVIQQQPQRLMTAQQQEQHYRAVVHGKPQLQQRVPSDQSTIMSSTTNFIATTTTPNNEQRVIKLSPVPSPTVTGQRGNTRHSLVDLSPTDASASTAPAGTATSFTSTTAGSSRPVILNHHSPPLSLFRSLDRSKIITLNKNQSFRILPQLPSPRIALTFQNSPVNLVTRQPDEGRGSSAEGGGAVLREGEQC